MTIKFHCDSCGKCVEAPDSAAGKRGKCPFCGHSSYIFQPMSDQDAIPLSDVDEEEERRRQKEAEELMARDLELLRHTGGGPSVPLEEKEDLSSEDLHHMVVNYCLDMFHGNLERTGLTAQKLRQFKFTAIQAVEDFRARRTSEPALGAIPTRVLMGFLDTLRKDLG